MEGKVDTEYNFWALSLDTNILRINTDMPLIIHITEKISTFTYCLFKTIAIICTNKFVLN